MKGARPALRVSGESCEDGVMVEWAGNQRQLTGHIKRWPVHWSSFPAGQFADIDIAEADLRAVRLQFDGAFGTSGSERL